MNRFLNNLDSTPLHSSGLAKAGGEGLGATSPQSFNQRRAIDRNRTTIKRYHDSSVARVIRAAETPADPLTQPPRPSAVRADRSQRATRAGFNAAGGTARPSLGALPTATPRFSEPPARGYNPYQ